VRAIEHVRSSSRLDELHSKELIEANEDRLAGSGALRRPDIPEEYSPELYSFSFAE
jgi:hypothetical protein